MQLKMYKSFALFFFIVFYPTSASELNAFFTRSMREKKQTPDNVFVISAGEHTWYFKMQGHKNKTKSLINMTPDITSSSFFSHSLYHPNQD